MSYMLNLDSETTAYGRRVYVSGPKELVGMKALQFLANFTDISLTRTTVDEIPLDQAIDPIGIHIKADDTIPQGRQGVAYNVHDGSVVISLRSADCELMKNGRVFPELIQTTSAAAVVTGVLAHFGRSGDDRDARMVFDQEILRTARVLTDSAKDAGISINILNPEDIDLSL